MHDLMCLHTSNDGSVVRKGACKRTAVQDMILIDSIFVSK